MSTPELLVSSSFSPDGGAAALSAVARTLQLGGEVDLVRSSGNGAEAPPTEDLRALGLRVGRDAVLPAAPGAGAWAAARDFTEAGLRQALTWDHAVGGYQHVRSHAPDAASHVLACRFVVQRPAARWTAEFDDPLSSDPTGRRTPGRDVEPDALLALLAGHLAAADVLQEGRAAVPDLTHLTDVDVLGEWLALVCADDLVMRSEDQLDAVVGALSAHAALQRRVRERTTVVPRDVLGVVGADGAPWPPDGRHHLLWPGPLLGRGDLAGLLDALGALPERLRASTVLHVPDDRLRSDRASLARRGLEEQVKGHDLGSHATLLRLARAVDCVVVHDAAAPDGGGFLPTVVRDLLATGTPVWGQVVDGGLLPRAGLALASPAGHLSSAVQVLGCVAGGEPRSSPGGG